MRVCVCVCSCVCVCEVCIMRRLLCFDKQAAAGVTRAECVCVCVRPFFLSIIHACTYAYTHYTQTHTRTHAHTHTCQPDGQKRSLDLTLARPVEALVAHAPVYVCMYVYVCMHVGSSSRSCTYVCVYACMYVNV
jgi:hypothetical protein